MNFKNFDGLELGDVLKPFYDRTGEFEKLCARLAQEQSPHDGTIQPIVFFNGLDESDQKIVDWHTKHEEQRLAKMLAPPDPVPTYTGGLLPSLDPGIITLSLLKQHSSQKERKPNAYALLRKVLQACCFKNYEGKIYLFTAQGVYALLSDERLKSIIFQILEVDVALCGNSQPIRQVQELLKAYPYIQIGHTTDDLHHIYFRNGCLDAGSGSFRANGSSDFFTSHLDFDYPLGSVPATPYTDAFFYAAAGGDSSWIEMVWEILGYLMIPDTSAKHFFLLQGVGDSGKSVLGDLISSLFNTEAVANIDIFRFKDRFSASGLEGCRVNVSMDLPSGKLSNEAVALIKMLTGGDSITLERKFKDAKPLKLNCKLVFGSNHQLLLAKPDEAFAQRLVVLPFQYAIPKEHQDPNLRDKLRQERPGIAVKAIAAYHRLRQRNYQFPELGFPGFSGVRGYVPMVNFLEKFIDEYCEFCAPDVFTPTNSLAEAFEQLCELHNIPGFQDTAQFSRSLNQFCAGRITRSKQRFNGLPVNGYYGIRLK